MSTGTKLVSRSESNTREFGSAVVRLLEESVETAARTGKQEALVASSHGRGKTAIVWLYLRAYTGERVSTFRGELADLLAEQREWSTSLGEELKRKLLKIRNLLAHGRMEETVSAVQSVRDGYPTRVGQVLSGILEIQSIDLLARIGIPKRTAERRLTQERFTREESDRLYRTMDITRYAVEVFGDADTATKWIKEPNPALGGVTPLSLVDTEPGTNKIRELLTRIDHGVYS